MSPLVFWVTFSLGSAVGAAFLRDWKEWPSAAFWAGIVCLARYFNILA